MKTFLKVVICVVAALLALKLFPLLLVPTAFGVGVTLLVGTVLAGCLAAVAATGLSVVAALLAVALVLVAVLSPIWVPVLVIVGVIALLRRKSATV